MTAIVYGNGARARIVVGREINGKKAREEWLRLWGRAPGPTKGARIGRASIPDAFIHRSGPYKLKGRKTALI